MFLTILDDDQPFDYRPLDSDTGDPSESVFQLRTLGDDAHRELQKKHTKQTFDKKLRRVVDTRDDQAFIADVIDYVILGWSGIRSARTGDEVPCTSDMKARLPERIKSEIIKVTVGKDVGPTLAEEKKLSAPISSSKPTT